MIGRSEKEGEHSILNKQENGHLPFTMMAAFCGLIWAVTNLSYDSMYHISMSQRLLSGDRMILEMWEPHQTSAFFSAALMWIYETLFHTTTGIALYLQACGIAIRGLTAVWLYRVFRLDLERSAAYRMALLFFMVSPKDCALPDFSNMQLWYSALLFCFLYVYLKTGDRRLLAAAALSLCLEVLSYPSSLLVYPGVIGLLICFSKERRKDICLFTGVCAAAGLAVGGYFLFTLGSDTIALCLKGMFALEPTHTVGMPDKLLAYCKDILMTVPVYLTAGAAAACVAWLLPCTAMRKGKALQTQDEGRVAASDRQGMASLAEGRRRRLQLWLLCLTGILLAGFLVSILGADKRNAYSLILLFVVAIGFWNRKNLAGDKKMMYACLTVIGGLGCLSALLLSNLPLFSSVPYGLLAVLAAWMSLERTQAGEGIRRGIRACFAIFVILLAFRCVYIRTPMTGRGQISSIFSDLSVVRTGPAFGIITNKEGVQIEHDTYSVWRKWMKPGDKVWIIGGVVNTLGYLYEDVEVAGPSTTSTPSYNSAVSEYWRLNPDKYPDVIVAECPYMEGNMTYELLMNEWLQSWLVEEYRPEFVVEGTYWKYFFRKSRAE